MAQTIPPITLPNADFNSVINWLIQQVNIRDAGSGSTPAAWSPNS
jgi:hypothetical protein